MKWFKRFFLKPVPQMIVSSSDYLIDEMLTCINEARTRYRKSILIKNDNLMRGAQEWAEKLADAKGELVHGDLNTRLTQSLRNCYAYEDIGLSDEEQHVEEVVTSWLLDPIHRTNLLADAEYIGIGCATLEDKNYWVVDLMKPIPFSFD